MTEAASAAALAEQYDDVSAETITLDVRGQHCPAQVFRPIRAGLFPAVAIGAEATGPNAFIRRVAATLAHLGYVTVVPDYYHGDGPPDPENPEDIETLMRYMAALDFRRAAYDLMAGVDYLKGRPDVDGRRLGVWGYCTGATVALLAACLRTDVAATVLFYPSQPRFEALDVNKPAHPVDLVWNLTSAVLLLVGAEDFVWPPELLTELQGRLEQWRIEHVINVYPGAGHAFCAPSPMFHHAAAETAAWAHALHHLAVHLR